MNLQDIFDRLSADQELKQLYKQISDYDGIHTHISGLKASAPALYGAHFHLNNPFDKLFVLPTKEEAEYFTNDLDSFLNKQKIHFFPSPYKNDDPNFPYNPLHLERIQILNTLEKPSKKGRVIVSYPEALVEYVVSRDQLLDKTSSLQVDNKMDVDFLIDYLHEYGFEQIDFVNEAGYFSLRGGIIDVFSYGNKLPYRIEFFDDQIESIREFDPETQLSVRRLDSISIIPNLDAGEQSNEFISVFKYLSTRFVIVFNNMPAIVEAAQAFYDNLCKLYDDNPDNNLLKNPNDFALSGADISKEISIFKTLDLSREPYLNPDYSVQVSSSPQTVFNKKFDLLAKNLQDNTSKNIDNFIFSDSAKQIERIYAIFEDKELDVRFYPIYSSLYAGFVDHSHNIACYSEHEIFQRFQKIRSSKVYSNHQALSLHEIYQLKPGDYVVHINHGIGKFSGLQKVENAGKVQEAIRLEYAGGDLLYVSIHSLHKISRYVGREGATPKLHRLGSKTWQNTKNKTKSRVKDIARDLIKLYASRRAAKGFAFSPDTYLQTELEASFIYEDTPDQAKVTDDIKLDMERSYPMDRLVCGDVGYGKTEVAVRAATKSVADNKQVAVLVPTTILAFQHFKTFSDRLSDFPVKIDYISRFRTAKQISEIKKKLADGKIDILIGTHKILGKDLKFKDLGLLIIDEEQKFGVAAKEKLRSLKVNVDTLSLSATPIPRTLQFSLMGVRDLSAINTPPPNRQPVETYLRNFDRDIIREAITKELNRNGQVFFVHNRIKDLEQIHEILRQEVPHAKIALAHGKLQSKELEEIMLNFIDGYYDVLLSTNIIESGLDIPNANTIIINAAHNFGLSDLYQMRGRVGRSNIKAYCYLLVPSFTTLSSDARKRLAAIEEFTDLGSGFQIAMRDLDIRGAGNLLGAEQSGFISEIGLDMYRKILEEAINELKLEEFGDTLKEDKKGFTFFNECQVDTDNSAMITDEYVENIEERLNLYHKLNRMTKESELDAFEKELTDRFGKIPYQTNDLLDLVRLKWVGQSLGMNKIILKNKRLRAYFPLVNTESDHFKNHVFDKVLRYVKSNMQNCSFNEKPNSLELVVNNLEFVDEALDVLRQMR